MDISTVKSQIIYCNDWNTAQEVASEYRQDGATVTLTFGNRTYKVDRGCFVTKPIWTLNVNFPLVDLTKTLLNKPACSPNE